MYDGGNYLNTNIGTSIPYSDNFIVPNAYLGSAGQYFTRKYQGLFVFAADLDSVDYFEITGNLGADGYGTADDAILTSVFCGKTYKGFVKRVFSLPMACILLRGISAFIIITGITRNRSRKEKHTLHTQPWF